MTADPRSAKARKPKRERPGPAGASALHEDDGRDEAEGRAGPNRHAQLALIRALDLIAAVAGGTLTLPILIVLAVLIRLDSPGAALFRQQRIGLGERLFTCYKLRTMFRGTPAAGTHEVGAVHVTPLGRWLRRLKIDELPQLWNVLRGEMSLVGPRPCLPSQTELIEARRALGVLEVRPGVTGRAQVKGIDMSTPLELAREDALWAAAPNLKDYVMFVLMTAFGKGQGDVIRS